MHTLTIIPPKQLVMQILDNYQVTRKQGEKQYCSSGGESLDIRNSSGKQEKRKIDAEPKRTKVVLYKTYIVFFLFHAKFGKNKNLHN